MLTNAGVILAERHMPRRTDAFDEFGHSDMPWSAAVSARPVPQPPMTRTISASARPAAQARATNPAAWNGARSAADDDGVLNFKKMGLPGPMENAAVYLSFWVWSPRPLDNLLVEPNLPRLDLLARLGRRLPGLAELQTAARRPGHPSLTRRTLHSRAPPLAARLEPLRRQSGAGNRRVAVPRGPAGAATRCS